MNPVRQPWRDFLHLAGFWSLAVVQPILALAGDHPEVLGPNPRGTLPLALLLLAGPPAGLAALRAAADRFRSGAGLALHYTTCAALVSLVALQVLNRFTEHLPPWMVLVDAGLLALVITAAIRRYRAVSTSMTVLACTSLLVALAGLVRLPVVAHTLPALPGSGPPVSVVWVVFDELPVTTLLDERENLDARNYPNFARLAGEATWYRRATSVSPSTPVSIPAMLTGRYPLPNPGPPTADRHPDNLLQVLRASHRVAAFEPVTALAPRPEAEASPAAPPVATSLGLLYAHFVVPPAWRPLLPRGEREFAVLAGQEFHYGQEVQRLLDFASRIRPGERPSLVFLHSVLPHRPWRHYPSGRSFGPPGKDLFPGNPGVWSPQPWQSIQAYGTHLMQAACADRVLGALVDRLKARGMYDRCLLVVTADHGVAFAPGADRRSEALPAQTLSVPMLVKLPFQAEGRVDDRCTETVDLLPTVLEACGREVPAGLDGVSLLDPARTLGHTRYVLAPRGPMWLPEEVPGVASTARWKARLLGPEGTLEGLFRLAPGESHLGRTVESLDPVPEVSAVVEHPEQYLGVDAEALELPAPVIGTVEAPPGVETVAVAIAVDGVVRADTLAWKGSDGFRFLAVLPESTWHAGDHRVEAVATAVNPSIPRELLP